MQEEGGTGIKEDACQDRNPGERDEVNGEIEPQRQARKRNDDEDLQAEKEDRRCLAEVLDTEDIKIDDEQAEEKGHKDGLAKDRERALPIADIFYLVSAP